MYDRGSRLLTRPATNTAPSVGPGTYYNPNSKTKAESYAPFQSMSVRESFLTLNEGVAAAPGPGHYTPLISSSGVKGGNSLNYKSNRFHSATSTTPGPGTYAISSKWERKPHHTLSKDPIKINFRRQGNAPSIPSCGYNNGYEEDSKGTLKPQEIPSSDSTLGPAFYNVAHTDGTTVEKYKGIHFGNLRSNRHLFEEHDGPGPSDYSPKIVEKSSQIHSSDFVSTNIPRYHDLIPKEEEVKGVPGPGQYDLKSQFELKKLPEEPYDPEVEKVPFGSSLQRFTSEKQISPACTAYQDPRTALSSIHRLHGMKRTPFSQSSKRFKYDQETINLPGPGTYNDSYVTGMSAQLFRKVMLDGFKNCPFGSTSARTVPLTKKHESLMPGPADYQENSRYHRANDRLSHAFASTTNRFYPSATDIPPPGSYEVSDDVSTQGKIDTRAAKAGFLSTLERFAPPRDISVEEPDVYNPGPSEYSVIDQQKQLGGVIGSEQPRFRTSKTTTPGPGAYELSKSQRDTLLQGTYNSTLVNPLREGKKHTNALLNKQTKPVLIGV